MSSFITHSLEGTVEPRPIHRTPLIIPSKAPATVKIVSDETECGFMHINASEFDAKVHTLFEDDAKPARKGKSGA